MAHSEKIDVLQLMKSLTQSLQQADWQVPDSLEAAYFLQSTNYRNPTTGQRMSDDAADNTQNIEALFLANRNDLGVKEIPFARGNYDRGYITGAINSVMRAIHKNDPSDRSYSDCQVIYDSDNQKLKLYASDRGAVNFDKTIGKIKLCRRVLPNAFSEFRYNDEIYLCIKDMVKNAQGEQAAVARKEMLMLQEMVFFLSDVHEHQLIVQEKGKITAYHAPNDDEKDCPAKAGAESEGFPSANSNGRHVLAWNKSALLSELRHMGISLSSCKRAA